MRLIITDLEKATATAAPQKKRYGHVAHTRRDPRSGKLVFVKQKGIKPTQVRVAKHVNKEDATITFLQKRPRGLTEEEREFWNLLQERGVTNVPQANEALTEYLGEEDTKALSVILRDWSKRGMLSISVPAPDKGAAKKAERKADAKKGKKTYWKTLVNPGVDLPPPYEPKGLKIDGKKASPVAEEMAWALAPFLLADDPKRQPDKTFLRNFSEDFAEYAGIRIPPNLEAFQAAFKDVLKARKKEAKPKAAKSEPVTPESRPHQFATIDGETHRITAKAYPLLQGRIFVGTNSDSAKNSFRGRWVPPITKKDITLNGTEFPPDAEEYGETISDPTARWVTRIRVPRHVHSSQALYVYKDGVSNAKWDGVTALAENYQPTMDAIRAGLNGPQSALCAAIALIDSMYIRVGTGSGEDDEEGGVPSKGLTDLTHENLWLKGDELHFKFVAKAGETWDSKKMGLVKCPPELIRALRNLGVGEKPHKSGKRVFESVKPSDINAFLQMFHPKITAHKFRHLHGTRIFREEIANMRPAKDKKEAQAQLKRALAVVGLKLGHKNPEKGGGTARQYYVHPSELKRAMETLGYDLRNAKEKKNDLLYLDEKLVKAIALEEEEEDTPNIYEVRYALDRVPPSGMDDLAVELGNV